MSPVNTPKKVLLIDDDAKICDLISAFLKLGAKNVTLVTAEDTVQANFKLENDDFDLIIVDKNLPTRSGLEFIKGMRSSLKYQKMKIILLSGSLNNDDVLFAVENKVSDIIVKPFKFVQFLEKLKKNL